LLQPISIDDHFNSPVRKKISTKAVQQFCRIFAASPVIAVITERFDSMSLLLGIL
jgi:hypothetical protein